MTEAEGQSPVGDTESGGILTGVGALLHDTRALMSQLHAGGGRASEGAFLLSSPSQSNYQLNEDYIPAKLYRGGRAEATEVVVADQMGASPTEIATR